MKRPAPARRFRFNVKHRQLRAAFTILTALSAENLTEEQKTELLEQIADVFRRDLAKKKRGVCSKCACTWVTPCAGGCAWTDETETLCTACAAPQLNVIATKKKKKKKKKRGGR